jgi:hypothetical protein
MKGTPEFTSMPLPGDEKVMWFDDVDGVLAAICID